MSKKKSFPRFTDKLSQLAFGKSSGFLSLNLSQCLQVKDTAQPFAALTLSYGFLRDVDKVFKNVLIGLVILCASCGQHDSFEYRAATAATQPVFTCSKLTIKTLEQEVEHLQSFKIS